MSKIDRISILHLRYEQTTSFKANQDPAKIRDEMKSRNHYNTTDFEQVKCSKYLVVLVTMFNTQNIKRERERVTLKTH